MQSTPSSHNSLRKENSRLNRWTLLFLSLGMMLVHGVVVGQVVVDPDSTLPTPASDTVISIDETGNTRTIEQLKVATDTLVPAGIRLLQDEPAEKKRSKADKPPSKRKQRLDGLLPPNPQVAVRRSLILPGWGQIYNRSAWKVPVIYGGFAVFAAFIIDNNKQYKYHSDAVKCIQTTGCTGFSEFDDTPVENVISTREFHRRFRDLNFIFAGLWYMLQAVDAYTEAHLKEFDVSDDLSLQLRPSMMAAPFKRNSQVYMGATFSIRLRK